MTIKAVFHLSKPVSDSILKPVSVCMCKCCGRFGFGAVASAARVTTIRFPLNMSAKSFTLDSHVPNVLYAKLQIAHIYNKIVQQFVNRKNLHVFTILTPTSGFMQ